MGKINPLRKVLPKILAVLTGHPRYFPEFEWSNKLWVHNVFRAYELIFGRRYGIRAEVTSAVDDSGRNVQYAHSFEAACGLFEARIREALSFKFVPFRIYIPQIATPQGVTIPTSPYLFAIAFDASSGAADNSAYTSITSAHTITGSATFLLAFPWARTSEHTVSGLTYNAVSMTSILSIQQYLNSDTNYAYYIVNPTTGSNNIVVSFTASASGYAGLVACSYSGCKQTGQPDASASDAGDGSSNNWSQSVTTVADNCWLVGAWRSHDGTCSAGANTTIRNTTYGIHAADSGAAKTPAGSHSLAYSSCGNRVGGKIIISVAPGGNTYTITAALGTYTLTGIAAALRSARTMIAALGTYTLTGIAATLKRGFGMVASTGSYVYTGFAASMFLLWSNVQKNLATMANSLSKHVSDWNNEDKSSF